MCTTCGCESTDEVKIRRPGEVESHETANGHHHSHDDGHSHDHTHHHQDHYEHETVTLDLERDILQKNNLLAERNRGYFEAKNILALNIVSSPGSGKTTILEKTITNLSGDFKLNIVEGDQQTMNDANRIAAAGAPVVQVNTGKGCHLDSDMIHKSIINLNPEQGSIFFIENVGNLVCPAMFDLGESKRVVIMSVTEGEDKPLKYPAMFETSQLCLINKVDLLPYLEFDLDKSIEYIQSVNPGIEIIQVSATTKDGLVGWYHWIKQNVSS
jgi:hydrogenase nickel incorporation protein HypB